MASVRKRTWTTAAGETKTAWAVDFVDQGGARQRRQFPTKKTADAFRVQVEGQINAGTFRADAARVTVEEIAGQWLTHCEVRQKRGQRMERSTLENYRALVRRFILGENGVAKVKLNALTGRAVRAFRDRLLDNGMSIILVRQTLGALRMTLQYAIESDIVAVNPVDGVEVLDDSRVKTGVSVPPKDAVMAVIEAAAATARPYIIVAALCGLRASETRALRWGDIDFERRLIRVRQRADRFNAIGEPKSAAGQRDVPAGPMVLNTLKGWRGDRIVRPDQLVFPSARGKIQTHSGLMRRDFYPLFESLDERHRADPEKHPKIERFRWHDLRHFAISLWIEQGFSVKEVMSFAGHGDYRMTMERYGHLFPKEDHQRGMAAIEARLFRDSDRKA